jgi:hypothetical protein
MLDNLISEFNRRNELPKSDKDYIVNDDTQSGIEFAFEQQADLLKRCSEQLNKMNEGYSEDINATKLIGEIEFTQK